MNRIILSLLLAGLAATLPASGQGTAGPLTLISHEMRQLRPQSEPSAQMPLGGPRSVISVTSYIPAIIRVADASTSLPDFATELGRRGDLVLINVPEDRLTEVLSAPGVLRMESGVCAVPAMDMARTCCHLPEALAAFTPELTGKGVVVGFSDVGFDPNHINFSDGAGCSRVKEIYSYRRDRQLPVTALTPAEIAAWSTDDPHNWHATHVAGILAGSYRDNSFYGVAPDAAIVATTSPLYDAYLLAGAERCVEYARSIGAPAPVVNMSVSSMTGPHDGTTLFNQYMRRLAEDAVICISAGNEGNRWGAAFPFRSSAARPCVQAIAREHVPARLESFSGVVDFWSYDDTPVTLRMLVYDLTTSAVTATVDLSELYNGTHHDLTLVTADLAEATDGTVCEPLGEAFRSAWVRFSWEINPENGRYNIVYAFDWDRKEDGQHEYRLGFELEAPEGKGAEVYASSDINFQRTDDPAVKPDFTNTMTINDLACGGDVAVVGAFVSRATGSDVAGKVAQFSSFGRVDGRTLPDFCAPGAAVVSSKSTPYYNANPDEALPQWSAVDAGGRMNYWDTASGTSMSSPYAAGVFALWLQACPTLTPVEILQAAAATLTPAPDSDPRWGGGILNAEAGLKEAMRLAGISDVTTDAASPIDFKRLSSTQIGITAYTVTLRSVTVTDMAGRTVMSVTPGAENYTLSLDGLPAGIYLVTASTARSTRTLKAAC